ncbi:hypothetical protein HK098_006323 [Nowakowskiella sp. JEL0407]|nr:hypothetical protein HK098_006323 [Nowakowskiella sp. JEL0407]
MKIDQALCDAKERSYSQYACTSSGNEFSTQEKDSISTVVTEMHDLLSRQRYELAVKLSDGAALVIWANEYCSVAGDPENLKKSGSGRKPKKKMDETKHEEKNKLQQPAKKSALIVTKQIQEVMDKKTNEQKRIDEINNILELQRIKYKDQWRAAVREKSKRMKEKTSWKPFGKRQPKSILINDAAGFDVPSDTKINQLVQSDLEEEESDILPDLVNLQLQHKDSKKPQRRMSYLYQRITARTPLVQQHHRALPNLSSLDRFVGMSEIGSTYYNMFQPVKHKDNNSHPHLQKMKQMITSLHRNKLTTQKIDSEFLSQMLTHSTTSILDKNHDSSHSRRNSTIHHAMLFFDDSMENDAIHTKHFSVRETNVGMDIRGILKEDTGIGDIRKKLSHGPVSADYRNRTVVFKDFAAADVNSLEDKVVLEAARPHSTPARLESSKNLSVGKIEFDAATKEEISSLDDVAEEINNDAEISGNSSDEIEIGENNENDLVASEVDHDSSVESQPSRKIPLTMEDVYNDETIKIAHPVRTVITKWIKDY